MKTWKTLAIAAILSLASVHAHADHYKLGDLSLQNTWTRATPPNAKAGGGFLEIVNKGSAPDRLIAGSSEFAGKVEMHEMAIVDDIMKMREIKGGIEIPAGETVTLKPGGLHVMFMGLKEPFVEGSTVPVTLTFEKAGDIVVELAVGKMGAKAMDGHAHTH